MDLLLRTYNVPDGTLFVDGKDVNTLSIHSVRAACAYVPQDNFLFSDTIAHNIAFGVDEASPEDIERAARLADVRDNIVDFKDGYETVLGERGVTVSGGQKQRVAIAGVVAMRPDCLILDEATAMLDPRGREQVMQTIHYLNRNMGITVVSITHYMEEAAQADRVLVMSKGHVVMEGTPKEVFSQTEKVRSLHLDVPQAAELRDELVKAGIPMPEGIIDTGECAQALYELLQ